MSWARRAAPGGQAIDGLDWLSGNGFPIHRRAGAAGTSRTRRCARGFAALFAARRHCDRRHGPGPPDDLPRNGRARSTCPRSPTSCWGILGISPDAMMCATSRMVVKRKGAARPVVAAPARCCPMTSSSRWADTLAEASGAVALNHPHCARFCVLGGGACSRGEAPTVCGHARASTRDLGDSRRVRSCCSADPTATVTRSMRCSTRRRHAAFRPAA